MPHKRHFDATEVKSFLGDQGKEFANELEIALSKMQDAKNLGAAMNHERSGPCVITARLKELDGAHLDLFEEATIQDMSPFIRVLLTMTRRYTAVVRLLGQKNMNADLKAYVNKNYPISKSELISDMTTDAKSSSLLVISWVLRNEILSNQSVDSLLHMRHFLESTLVRLLLWSKG